MSWRNIWFERKHGRLRAGWRVLLFLGVACAVSLMLALFLSLPDMLGGGGKPLTLNALKQLLPLTTAIAFILTGIWALRTFEQLPSYTLGLAMRGGWFRRLWLGFLAGALIMLLLGALLWGAGQATVSFHTLHPQDWLSLLLEAALILLPQTLFEEAIYHGYPFQTLLRGIGAIPAVLVTGLAATALMFAMQPQLSLITLANMLVLVILLGMVYLRTGSLWAPIGISTGWSFGHFFYLMTVPSGLDAVTTPFSLTVHGAMWLTGGAAGPDGGALLSLLLLAILALVTYLPSGLSLESRWWEWPQLAVPRRQPPAWDFAIGSRYYQWKLLVRDGAE